MSAHLTSALARRAVNMIREHWTFVGAAEKLTALLGKPVKADWIEHRAAAAGLTRAVRDSMLRRQIVWMIGFGMFHREIAQYFRDHCGRTMSRGFVSRCIEDTGITIATRREHLVPMADQLYCSGLSLEEVRSRLLDETGVKVSAAWLHKRIKALGHLRESVEARKLHIERNGHHMQGAKHLAWRRKVERVVIAGLVARRPWPVIAEAAGCSAGLVKVIAREQGLLRRTWKLRKTNSNTINHAPEGEKDTKPCASRRPAETRESTQHQETRSAAS